MRKTKIINRKTLSLSTFFVLGLFALYRIILEIYYSNNFWGYDTYTERSTTFGIYMAILLIPTIILMLKVFENASFRLKFSTASIQFLLAVLIATEIFNGGSFSGNGDIRMIILNTLVTVVLILLPILFVVQLSLYENPMNSRVAQNQEKYKKEYDAMIKTYDETKFKYEQLEIESSQQAAKHQMIKDYINTLKKQNKPLTKFDGLMWGSLLESATIKDKDTIVFKFKDGTEING